MVFLFLLHRLNNAPEEQRVRGGGLKKAEQGDLQSFPGKKTELNISEGSNKWGPLFWKHIKTNVRKISFESAGWKVLIPILYAYVNEHILHTYSHMT